MNSFSDSIGGLQLTEVSFFSDFSRIPCLGTRFPIKIWSSRSEARNRGTTRCRG